MTKMRTGHLRNYILPKFSDIFLNELEAVDIDNWLIKLTNNKTGEKLSGQTRNHIFNTFNIILAEAKRQKLITANPIDEIERLANKFRKRDTLTINEIKQLFPKDEVELLHIWKRLYFAALYYLMLTSGLRSGEIRALLWAHIIWNMSGILVQLAVKADNTIGLPKSNEIRGVLLPERTMKMLLWWKKQTPFSKPENLLFYGKDGTTPVNKKTVSKNFKPALLRSGIDIHGRNLVAHSLRHTYNTRMRNVLTEAMLQYMAGHRSKAMTDRYDQATAEDRLKQFLPDKHKIDQAWE